MECALDAHPAQEQCALGEVAAIFGQAHTVHMAKPKTQPRHFLRAWRKFRGYTLERVAEHVGMTHQNLGKIERGQVPFNEPLLDILADYYRTDRGSLIMRDPNQKDALWSILDQLPVVKREKYAEQIAEEERKTGTDG